MPSEQRGTTNGRRAPSSLSADDRLTRLRSLVAQLERLPASPKTEWMLAQARARLVDVETGETPQALRPLDVGSPVGAPDRPHRRPPTLLRWSGPDSTLPKRRSHPVSPRRSRPWRPWRPWNRTRAKRPRTRPLPSLLPTSVQRCSASTGCCRSRMALRTISLRTTASPGPGHGGAAYAGDGHPVPSPPQHAVTVWDPTYSSGTNRSRPPD
jgi:hypothetical protein